VRRLPVKCSAIVESLRNTVYVVFLVVGCT
jgi:hypothetical protein